MILQPWYDAEGTPERGTWWWAVEHLGHPAFYLRMLLPGDFAPDRAPAPRHAVDLEGHQVREGEPVSCGTCGKLPRADDLEVVERATGASEFLAPFRAGRAPWPRPTNPSSCWLCSDPRKRVQDEVETPGGLTFLCEDCARFARTYLVAPDGSGRGAWSPRKWKRRSS